MRTIARSIIIAVAVIGLSQSFGYAESLTHVANGQKTQVVYDESGNIETIVHYSKPRYQKKAVVKKTYGYRSEWEARQRINSFLANRRR